MYNGYHFYGMHFMWWFIWFVFIIWGFAIPYDIPGTIKRNDSPLDILKKCFASGKINIVKYQKQQRVLLSYTQGYN
jgi:putative membrane protein